MKTVSERSPRPEFSFPLKFLPELWHRIGVFDGVSAIVLIALCRKHWLVTQFCELLSSDAKS